MVYVSDPLVSNSPVEVETKLWVKDNPSAPFGNFATPLDGTSVCSSIPVTGWVLGDTGIENVKIYREEGSSLVYIGDAVSVEGARPDVEAAFYLSPVKPLDKERNRYDFLACGLGNPVI